MPMAGLEPARDEPLDFESSASANSATSALLQSTNDMLSYLSFDCNSFFTKYLIVTTVLITL